MVLDKNMTRGKLLTDYVVALDLTIDKMYFKKKERLVMYKSGKNRLQIDYFLLRVLDKENN